MCSATDGSVWPLTEREASCLVVCHCGFKPIALISSTMRSSRPEGEKFLSTVELSAIGRSTRRWTSAIPIGLLPLRVAGSQWPKNWERLLPV